MNKIQKYQAQIFEDIKHIDEYGKEYWFARELMRTLKYSKWQNFEKVIEKAKISCENSGNIINYWFTDISKPITTGKGKTEIIKDYKLTRYACYLIVQNGDARKEEIALGQTYFAVQTRKMELVEDYLKEYANMTEDEKRFYQRSLTKKGNFSLNQTAKKCGVKNFDKFHNAGYRGLYNGETADDIAKRKGLRYREDILDNMGSEELADNLFRIVQTEAKIKRDNVQGENNASKTHYDMGKNIRKFIDSQGGSMPEDLPTPKKSLKQIEKEEKNNLIK